MSNNMFNRENIDRSFGNTSGFSNHKLDDSDLQPSNTFQRSHLDTNTILSQTSAKAQEDLRYAQSIILLKL